MIKEHAPVLVILVPLLSAVLVPLVGMLRNRFCWHVAFAATHVSFLLSGLLLFRVQTNGKISYRLGGWEPPWGIEYVIDELNSFVLVTIAFIGFLATLYARKSVVAEIEPVRIPAFYSIFLLFLAGLLGIVITGDIFNLYVFLEISSLAGYALIAASRKREALLASYNYLILGTIAATFILIGIGYLYMVTGSLNMADLRERLPALYHSKVVLTAFAFFSVGISLKLALFPLHVWLPNAYTYAPSVVSAVMAATATKVGAYVLFRIMFTVFRVEFDLEVVSITSILLVLSSAAIILGSVLAIAQTNIKRMLAYSSVGQIGYIVLGASIVNETAMTGSLVHILNHALMKGTLFFIAGCVLYRTGIEDIAGLRGMGRRMPFSMAAFTVAGLSMAGVPLTVGFVSKWYLALGALRADLWYLVPVILVSSLLTAVYFGRIIESIYFGRAEDGHSSGSLSRERMHEAPTGMLVPALLLAGLCLVFGISASTTVGYAEAAARLLLGGR